MDCCFGERKIAATVDREESGLVRLCELASALKVMTRTYEGLELTKEKRNQSVPQR